MKLLVQEYLENHTFDDLIREHGVYASFSKSGHKWSLNYDQIEAKESDPLAQECRGLVLACESGVSLAPQALTLPGQKTSYNHLCPGKTVVLAYPMKRFFNHGQGSAAQINWSDPNLAVLEKLDGTLCIVYYDKFIDQWCVATRSVPEADLLMDNGLFTFRTLFEKAIKDTTGFDFQPWVNDMPLDYTLCFELTTPYNRIVVDYKTNGVTLLAARNMKTLQEENLEDLRPNMGGVPLVQSYTYNNIDDLVSWVSSLNPMEHEGVVVRDSNFNRIKVKNAAYVAYNKVRDTLSTSERNCVELILAEKDDDVIPFLPEEIVKNLRNIKKGVQIVLRQHDEMYQKARAEADAKAPGDKKTFAILVTANKELWSSPFFYMWDGKCANMKDFFAKTRKDGTWSNSTLDKVLELAKKANP